MKLLELQKRKPNNTYPLTTLSGGSFSEHLAVLGLFKIIHEQLDKRCQGYWQNNTFYLQTDASKEDLLKFFSEDYSPLPLFCVWDNNSKHEAIVKELPERFASQQEAYEELMAIRQQFNPNYNSSEMVKVGKKDFSSKKMFLSHLFKHTNNKRFRDILTALVIPYDWQGVEQVFYTQLGSGKAGYLPNQRCIDLPYWNSVLGATREHFESTLFGVAHPNLLLPDCSLPHLETYGNWGDQSQFGIGHESACASTIQWMGEKVEWGSDPVLTLLMVEGMTFYRGRLGTRTSHQNQLKGVDFNEASTSSNDQVRTMPFVVKNHSVSFTTGSWQSQSKGGFYEIWAPQWETPLTYRGLLSEIRNLSEVAQTNKVSLTDALDMMMFLSQKGRDNGVTIFHRYLFSDRQGRGDLMVLPIEKFDCRKDMRTDVLTCLLPAMKLLRKSLKDIESLAPNSVLTRFEHLQREVDSFIAGGSSITELSRLFVGVVRHLKKSLIGMAKPIQYKEEANGKLKPITRLDLWFYPTLRFAGSENEVKVRGRAVLDTPSNHAEHSERNLMPHQERRFRFGEQWVRALLTENDSPEVRVALSQATQRPHSNLNDISQLLDGQLDSEMIDDLRMMLEMCFLPEDLTFGVTTGETPWMPIDYVISALLLQSRSGESNADESDTASWYSLMSYRRGQDALETAVRRLRLRHTIHRPIPVFQSTDTESLMEAVKVPLCKTDLQRLGQLVNH